MRKTHTVMMLSLTAVGLTMVAACSSSAESSGSSTTSSSSGAGTPAAGTAIRAQSTALGTILVNASGRTVYVFANDTTNVSNCNDTCATAWPPVSAPSPLPTSLPGVSAALGTVTRSDGSHQLSIAGHPIYTFSGDSAAGQTHGQGINLNGGVWTVVSPAGSPQASPAGATTSAPGPAY
jgi:predicted lipoprotein with Yx(FWY)xxD motif